MAYTLTNETKTVFGNKKVHQFTLEVDATSGAVETALDVIDHIEWSVKSASTACEEIKVKPNLTTDAAASNGSVYVISAASGDDLYITCYGR